MKGLNAMESLEGKLDVNGAELLIRELKEGIPGAFGGVTGPKPAFEYVERDEKVREVVINR